MPTWAHSSHSDLVGSSTPSLAAITNSAQLADEVCVAGGVDQIDLDTVELKRRQREANRALLGDLRFVVVADRGAVDNGALTVEYPGGEQEGLDECRLAATRWAHQHHIADGGRTVRGGGGSGALGRCRLVSHDGSLPGSHCASHRICQSTIPRTDTEHKGFDDFHPQ